MNVLIYTGPEIASVSSINALSTLRSILHHTYSVQPLSSEALLEQPWSSSCALLVLPRFTRGFDEKKGQLLREYVEGGGKLLGLGMCAVTSQRTKNKSMFGSERVICEFWDKGSGKYVYPTYAPESSIQRLVAKATSDTEEGGEKDGEFELDGILDAFSSLDVKHSTLLGTFSPSEAPAGIKIPISSGTAAFWAANIERSTASQPHHSILRKTLASLSLHVPPRSPRSPSPDAQQKVVATKTHQIPTQPLPQFLVSSNPAYVSQIIQSLSAPLKIPPEQLSTFTDDHDTFQFYPETESKILLEEERAKQAPKEGEEDKTKKVIIHSSALLPSTDKTPLFDLELYFQALSKLRAEKGLKGQEDDVGDGGWGIGEVLFYSEAVTSTQTMFDKNPRFHTHLPTPVLSLASYQLSGRGRGSNIWISPSGCLQFSLLLRLDLKTFPTAKLVFIQYLFALAVAEGVRSTEVLGEKVGERVRLKWPNDIYALFPTEETEEDGRKKEERRKIGGILVGTSFGKGSVDVIIGCGVNVSTAPPVSSLQQLLPSGPEELTLSHEKTLAAILTTFEGMWAKFVEKRGGFDDFMGLYLERWLHSDELITITTVSPPIKARISGITSDHGLLRTVKEHHGWSTERDQFIDLQPDGNSFDMMRGLIGVKR